uniref:CSD domain-containing protein n=1 Tax=Eutreptiella gymnastica TaxID=73025 RepID=A0A7S4D0T4_9EUGL
MWTVAAAAALMMSCVWLLRLHPMVEVVTYATHGTKVQGSTVGFAPGPTNGRLSAGMKAATSSQAKGAYAVSENTHVAAAPAKVHSGPAETIATLLLVPLAFVASLTAMRQTMQPGNCLQEEPLVALLATTGEKSAELAAEDAAKSSTDSKAEAEVALRLRYADTLAQGFSETVYKDSNGFLTAGWGHRLTEEEAMKYEEGDVVDEETLNRWEDEEELDEDEVEFDAAEFDFDAEDWDEVGEGGEGENEDNDEGEDEDEDEDAQAREAADDSGLPKQLEAEESFLDQDVTQFDKEFADYLSQGAARMATAPDPPLAQEPPQFVDISRDAEGDQSIVDSSDRNELGTVTGVCTRWLSARGFGFVLTDDGNTEVFVHQSSIVSEGFRSLQVGEKVELELVEENGKMVGMGVKSLGGGGSDSSAGGRGEGKGMSNGKGKEPWDESGSKGNSKGYTSGPDDGGKGASPGWGGRGRPQNYLVQDADYVGMSDEEGDLGPGDSMPMQKGGVGKAGKGAVDYGGKGTIETDEDVWDDGKGGYSDFGKGGKGYDDGKGMGKGGKGDYGGKGGFDDFGQGKEKGSSGKGGFDDNGKGKGKGFDDFVKGKGGFDDFLGMDLDDFAKGKGLFDDLLWQGQGERL